MTLADERALEVLRRENGRLVGPGYVGSELWGERQRGGNCSCPWARPAGKVLKRLERAGLAEWVHEGSSWGWRVTEKGKK